MGSITTNGQGDGRERGDDGTLLNASLSRLIVVPSLAGYYEQYNYNFLFYKNIGDIYSEPSHVTGDFHSIIPSFDIVVRDYRGNESHFRKETYSYQPRDKVVVSADPQDTFDSAFTFDVWFGMYAADGSCYKKDVTGSLRLDVGGEKDHPFTQYHDGLFGGREVNTYGRAEQVVSSKGGRFIMQGYELLQGESGRYYNDLKRIDHTFLPVNKETTTVIDGVTFIQPDPGDGNFSWEILEKPDVCVRLEYSETEMVMCCFDLQLFNYDMSRRYKVEVDYPDNMPVKMKVVNGVNLTTSMDSRNPNEEGYYEGDSKLVLTQFLSPSEKGLFPVKYRIYAENGDTFERTIDYLVTDDGKATIIRDYPKVVNVGQSYEVKIICPYDSYLSFQLPQGFEMECLDRMKYGGEFCEETYRMTVGEDAPLGYGTITTECGYGSGWSWGKVTDTIEVLGSTELIVEAPDEVEEETEYTVDVFFYQDGRDIEVTVPEGVNMIPGNAWFDYPSMRALQEYTLIVDEEYEEASFTLTVSDGHTTFSKEINVTEKEIIMPTITFSPSALDFVQAGETKTLTVTYTDTTTEFINRPYSSDLGVTIHETSLTQNGTNVVGTYAVTVESTIYATTIPLIFSCSSPQGASSTATLLATQQGGSPDTGETRGWITLDKYIAYVPADGGEVFVKAHFGYPVGKEVLSCRVRNANGVYPIAWCKGILTGGEVEDDGTEGNEDWKFILTANTATESRTAVCVFSYTNFYGEKGSATLTIVQDAGDGEDVTQEPSEIVPYVSLIKMTAEGENYYGGSTDYFNVNYFKIAERNTPSVNVDWFRIIDSQVISEGQFDVLVRYWYECDANSLTNPRNAEITLSGTDEYGETVTAKVSVQQARHTAPEDGEEGEGIPSEPGVYIGQIWKDVVYTFGNLEKVSYTIWKGNTMIFKGISWLRPSTGVNSILVNRICQNYLGVPELKKGSVGTIVGYDTFTLRNGEGTVTYATYKFVNAWNYNDEFRTGLLSYPILDRPFVVRGQMTPFSVFGAGEEVKVAFGVTYKNYVDDFGNVTEGWGSTDYVNDGIYHDYFTVTAREKDYISSVYIGNREYQVEEPCRIRYVLYYLNPWGGLDWFPITGNYRMTDNITQYTYTRNYNNTTREFGKSRYLAEIERKYTLTTGWLKQSESDRMWYLLESNLVYLHDLQEDKVIPVTIDDTTLEHKRKDRMNKIIQYTFTVTESQLRERI